jgi:putative ABC transport system permease protein
MLNHYLLLIYRNFLRSKGYFLINLAGLTIGLVCTLLIFLWVRDEFRMNKVHANDANLYQVMEHQQYADEIMTTNSTPGILAETLKEEMPEVQYAATTTWLNPYTLSIGDHNIKAKGYHVGTDYFNIFSYKLVQGEAASVLKDMYDIVISRDLAKRLFDTEENILGKTVEIDHDKSFRVTGIFESAPYSSLQFDFVMSFDYYKANYKWVMEWGNNGPSTFIVLREGSDPVAFTTKIKDYVKGKNKDSNVTLFIQQFSERYLYGRFENGLPAGGRIEYVRLFSIIAAFILVIACINFMNLSTARASRKAKEVGIKKSIGAGRKSLIFQYLSESVITALLSLGVAIVVVSLFLPLFNVITDKKIVLTLNDFELYSSFVGIALFTGLVAGSYPALYLSGFKPAAVLKGVVKGSVGELWARKGLVVFQFFLSVILIVSVLVIYKQIEFVQSKNLGYNKEHLIQLPREGKLKGDSYKAFITEVKRTPGVVDASSISHGLVGRNSNTSGLKWEGKDPDDDILFENMSADYGIFETLGLEFVDGRGFSEEMGADTSKIVFNEAAIRVMNLKDPIGKHIKLWDEHDLEIVGVVKDFHFESLHDVVSPAFFRLASNNTWAMMIRLEAGREKEALASLTKLYAQFNPGFTFEYKFQDAEYARQYAAEQRVATLSSYFASMAILISCLGLFGLAAFTAERRLKEIGIRKALGSSSTNIVILLSGDFTKMVVLSIVLGLPISYWLLDMWLAKFAFRIDLKAWYFIVAGLIALLVAWVTVASQAIRASRVNPVKCLRTE